MRVLTFFVLVAAVTIPGATSAAAGRPRYPLLVDRDGVRVYGPPSGHFTCPSLLPLPKGARAEQLEAVGVGVHVYPASELNKGDGGPTCLTRPILRI